MSRKNLFKKTLEKAVSQLQMESDEGAEDCRCSFDPTDFFRFVYDCSQHDGSQISNVTESFCVKEPELGGIRMTCKGRCKRVYTCTRSDPFVEPSERVTTKTVYGDCMDRITLVIPRDPETETTPSRPNLETR